MYRCPRCNGFLYDSVYAYRWFVKGILHCFTCARDWRVVRRGRHVSLVSFSTRREWDEQRRQAQAVA